MIYLAAEEIIAINARHLGGKPAVRDAGQVASAAMRPQAEVFGEELFPAPYEKAAALLHSLICTYPFIDGNKRTAWAATRVFATLNDVVIALTEDEAFNLVMHVAEDCSQIDVKNIASALAREDPSS